MGETLKLDVFDHVNGASKVVIQVLADVSQIDLTVGKNGDIYGEMKVPYRNQALDLKGAMEVKISSSFVSINGDDVGLLIHVAGNLYVMLFGSEFDKVVRVMVLDVSKGKDVKNMHGLFESRGVRSLKGALKIVGSMVVKAYEREFSGTVWTPHTIEQ